MSLELIIGLSAFGVLLLLVEIFIPGGIAGVIGAIMLIIGIIGGFSQSTTLGIILIVNALAFALLSLWLWIKFFPRSPFGKRLILADDGRNWHSSGSNAEELIGKTGHSQCTLRPGGIAIIDGQRMDVVTRGEIVEAKRMVRIIEVEGNRIVVTEEHVPEDN